jgi:tRNA(fMet)-specific endonuclease VapC
MSFLLDTDICSAYLKGNHAVGNKFEQHGGRLHISAITAGELFAWVLRSKAPATRLEGLLALLDEVDCIETDLDVARQFGEIRASQLDHGLFTPEMDLLIAATAILHGHTLVTHNVEDYANVPGLEVVDWLAT